LCILVNPWMRLAVMNRFPNGPLQLYLNWCKNWVLMRVQFELSYFQWPGRTIMYWCKNWVLMRVHFELSYFHDFQWPGRTIMYWLTTCSLSKGAWSPPPPNSHCGSGCFNNSSTRYAVGPIWFLWL
jgi:hypothetical protein